MCLPGKHLNRFPRKHRENIIKLFHLFESEKGGLFSWLFSRKTNRKNLSLSQLFPRETLCLFLCLYSWKTDNQFAMVLLGKMVTCFLAVFQENRSHVFWLLSQKKPISSLVYNLSRWQAPTQDLIVDCLVTLSKNGNFTLVKQRSCKVMQKSGANRSASAWLWFLTTAWLWYDFSMTLASRSRAKFWLC